MLQMDQSGKAWFKTGGLIPDLFATTLSQVEKRVNRDIVGNCGVLLKHIQFCLFAVGSGGHPVCLAEAVFKVVAAIIAAVHGDLGDGIIRGQKHLTRLSDPDIIDILPEGRAGNIPEFPGKISRT